MFEQVSEGLLTALKMIKYLQKASEGFLKTKACRGLYAFKFFKALKRPLKVRCVLMFSYEHFKSLLKALYRFLKAA